MCSNFREMEKYGGDLADILRVSGGGSNPGDGEVSGISDWQFQNHQIDYRSGVGLGLGVEEPLDEFGDPFSNLQDPLLLDIETQSSSFFNNIATSCADIVLTSSVIENPDAFQGGDQSITASRIAEQELKRPTNNFFSRMLQISPNTKLCGAPRDSATPGASQRGVKTAVISVNDMMSTSKDENAGVQQISVPRNAGIKRRKSQAKKVVCIPAPAPVNSSRPGGEVVPSDLWAWRKYGQKPIKGSPYPRGYYRCSSSKGCPARKQVERSRTDPNMLVITYTCEHNHPWPTQRNALAGSTRTHPSKNGSTSKPSAASQSHKAATHFKEDQKEAHPHENAPSSILTGNSSTAPPVKEEADDLERQTEMEDDEFRAVFQQSYKPSLPVSNNSEDFFAELGELEADPMNLLFPHGYSEVEERENKSLDPFTFYDWAGNNSSSNNDNGNGHLLGEDEKGS